MATSPATPAAPNVSLSDYLGPLANADWTGKWLSFHKGYFRVTRLGLLALFAAIVVGAVLNVLFPGSLRHLNWIAVMAFLLIAVVCILTPANLFGPATAAFLAAQPGGEAGLSLADGTKWGKAWINALGRFTAAVALYGSLPFFVLALWPIGSNPIGAIAILACSVFLTIWSMYTNKDGKFVLNLAAGIMIALITWTLFGYTANAVAPEQWKRLSTWVESRWSVNPADKARDSASAKIRQARIDAAVKCYEELKPDASQADKDRCEALHRTIDESLVPKIAPILAEQTTAAGQVNGEHQSPAPAPTTAPAAPVKTAQAEPTWDCTATWKEVNYVPSEQEKGRMELGTLPAGRYTVRVDGTVWHDFYTGRPSVFDKRCEADADGRMGDCLTSNNRLILNRGGAVWPAPEPIPSVPRAHIPREAYGKLLLLVDGWPALPVGRYGTVQLSSDKPVALDLNNFQHPASYAGPGMFRVVIKQCQTT